jgi:hypothetical protein
VIPCVVGAVSTTALAYIYAAVILVASPVLPGTAVIVDAADNRVYYLGMDSAEAAAVIDTLREENFFWDQEGFYVGLTGSDGCYTLSLPFTPGYREFPELRGFVASYGYDLERAFPDREIRLVVVDEVSGDTVECDHARDPLCAWMARPQAARTDSALVRRVLEEVFFWHAVFRSAVQDDFEYVRWNNIPRAFAFAKSCIELPFWEDIPAAWRNTFHNSDEAADGYLILRRALNLTDCLESNNVFITYAGTLEEMMYHLARMERMVVRSRARD